MRPNNIDSYKKRLEDARTKAENYEDDYEELVYELEKEILEEFEWTKDGIINHPNYGNVPDIKLPNGKLYLEYNQLLKEIKDFKEYFDFYDADGELDMLFPDRHDDDFDEDSMSYDSVFGDD